jgi:hypothetical protein
MLRVVGVGLGRTGTHSLKLALEDLLDGPCYHMLEVFEHLDHAPLWHAAVRGEPPDWDAIFDGFVATVDWPGAAFWRELIEEFAADEREFVRRLEAKGIPTTVRDTRGREIDGACGQLAAAE